MAGREQPRNNVLPSLRFPAATLTAQTSNNIAKPDPPIESTSPLRSTPYRVLWKFAIARAKPIDIMSFVTRRALSTLIPPKVGGFAACNLALSFVLTDSTGGFPQGT